ncbi:MAG: YhbY family RNA-binding protein [Verrucomicrobiales bacterium]
MLFMMQQLTNPQLRKLKGRAQLMNPDLKVGKNGVSESFLKMVEQELIRKELIKIKFDELKEQKKELARQIAEKTGARLVMQVGHVVVIYRQNPDPEKQVIQL